MLKKVLSVVLALVLTFGVCVVAASAASASQLQELLEQLPSEYNAHFYNNKTEALILEARAKAEAALSSGVAGEITEAYELCNQAFDEAYAGEEIYCEAIDDDMWVYTNRDESKAVADFYYETSAGEYLMPGETFTVTVSVKTNFYIRTMYTGFAYDKTKFEYVADSLTCPEANKATLDVESGNPKADWGYNSKGVELDGGFPDTWTAEMKAKYNLFERAFMFNPKGTDFFYPQEKTELYTLTMKVKEDAKLEEEGRIFVNNDLCATRDNYLLGSYSYPLVEFTRAYGPKIDDMVADMDGVITETYKVQDETACSGQTINFNGSSDFSVKIGEAPVELNYEALEAAIAHKDELDEADYTEETWAAYAAAVEAGKEEGLKADTQEAIDDYTADIDEKCKALVPFEQNSSIISVTPLTTPVVGLFATLEVLVSKPADKIQFVNAAGGTITYFPGYDRVVSVVTNEDNTQTWTIKIMVYQASEKYEIFPKFGRTWDTKYYRYFLRDDHEYDGNIYAVSVPDAYDSRVRIGHHDVIVETGLDVTKVQFAYLGTTATFTSNNATCVEKDGHNFWTVSFNFCKYSKNFTAELLSRTALTSFEKSDIKLVVDVL